MFVSQDDVLYQWALSEALSPRYRAKFEPFLGDMHYQPDFFQLADQHRTKLIDGLHGYRLELIQKYITPHAFFKIVGMNREQLLNSFIMPEMGWDTKPVSLSHYMKGVVEASNDPRNIIKSTTSEQIILRGFPIISWESNSGLNVIIEGFTRLLAFVESRSDATLDVFVCG